MSGTVEITEHGLVVNDADGACIAHVTLTSGNGCAALVISAAGDAPVAAEMTRDQIQQFEDLVHRTRFLALVGPAGRATPRVPRFPS